MQNETDKQQKTARLILDHSLFPRAPWMLIPVKQKGNPTVSVLGKKKLTKIHRERNRKIITAHKNQLYISIYLENIGS